MRLGLEENDMARKLNKLDQALLDWVVENQPGLVSFVEEILDMDGKFWPGLRPTKTLYILLQVGFEAGRKFQRDNPDAPEDLDGDDFTCA